MNYLRLKFLFWFSGLLPCRLIKIDDNPYLERYYLFEVFGFTFLIHRFIDLDGDRTLHNHPWSAFSVVLAGSYVEAVLVGLCPFSGWIEKNIKVRLFNYVPAKKFHQIVDIKPNTWTLFIHKKRSGRGWGFFEKMTLDDEREAKVAVIFHQPHPIKTTLDWHKTAPIGADIERELLVM